MEKIRSDINFPIFFFLVYKKRNKNKNKMIEYLINFVILNKYLYNK